MRAVVLLFGICFSSLLSRCHLNYDNTYTPLVADYWVVTNYEGYSCLHFQKHMWSEIVPLVQLDAAAIVNNYVVTCMSEGGRYYLLPLHPDTKEEIEKNTIGPLSRPAYRLKLFELLGDSTLQLTRVQ